VVGVIHLTGVVLNINICRDCFFVNCTSQHTRSQSLSGWRDQVRHVLPQQTSIDSYFVLGMIEHSVAGQAGVTVNK